MSGNLVARRFSPIALLIAFCTAAAILGKVPIFDQSAIANAADQDGSAIKVATVLGHDIFARDLEPTAEWRRTREEHLAKQANKMGIESVEAYRRRIFGGLIWQPLTEQIIGKQIVPTEDELQEFIQRYHESVDYRLEKHKQQLAELKSQAESLETQTQRPNQPGAAEIAGRLQKLRAEIKSLESVIKTDRQFEDEKQERFFAEWQVANWKKQQWFYQKYGGRVIYRTLGPVSIDGMRDFLKEQESKGRLAIFDPELKADFWANYLKEPKSVIVPHPAKLFEHPWSLLDLPAKDQGQSEK